MLSLSRNAAGRLGALRWQRCLANGILWGKETSDEAFAKYFEGGTMQVDEIKGLPKPELLEKYLSMDGMNRRDRIKEELNRTRRGFQRHDHDTGSSDVQGKATEIKALEWHMVRNRQDKAAPRIMQKLIHTRRKHLVYLRRTSFERYCTLIERLRLADSFNKQNRFEMYKARRSGSRYL